LYLKASDLSASGGLAQNPGISSLKKTGSTFKHTEAVYSSSMQWRFSKTSVGCKNDNSVLKTGHMFLFIVKLKPGGLKWLTKKAKKK
jgi:hypothetical protein